MYGLTECKRVSYLPPHLIDASRPRSASRSPAPRSGSRTSDGNECAPGEVGELMMRGAHVMQGYWNDPEATAKRLRPGRWPWERVLMTGDLFKRDAEGYLYFVGRKDDMIKSRGEKVAPREVEEVLYAVPGVRDAAVIGVPDKLLGSAIHAYVSVFEDARARRAHAQARLRGEAGGLHGPAAHRDPRRAAALHGRQDRQAHAQRRGPRAPRRRDRLTAAHDRGRGGMIRRCLLTSIRATAITASPALR